MMESNKRNFGTCYRIGHNTPREYNQEDIIHKNCYQWKNMGIKLDILTAFYNFTDILNLTCDRMGDDCVKTYEVKETIEIEKSKLNKRSILYQLARIANSLEMNNKIFKGE